MISNRELGIRNYTLVSRFTREGTMSYHWEHDKLNYMILAGKSLLNRDNGIAEAAVVDGRGNVVWQASR